MQYSTPWPPLPPLDEGLITALKRRFPRDRYDYTTDPRVIDYQSGQQSVIERLVEELRIQTEGDTEEI